MEDGREKNVSVIQWLMTLATSPRALTVKLSSLQLIPCHFHLINFLGYGEPLKDDRYGEPLIRILPCGFAVVTEASGVALNKADHFPVNHGKLCHYRKNTSFPFNVVREGSCREDDSFM